MLTLFTCCDRPDLACTHDDEVMVPATDVGVDVDIALRMSCPAAGSIMFDCKAGTDWRSSCCLCLLAGTNQQ